MLLDTENISVAKFLMHFQPFRGPEFPGGACPWTPLLLNDSTFILILSHSNKHAFLTPWFTTCTFATINSWQIFLNLDRILWEWVGKLVTGQRHSIIFQNWINRGVLLDKNKNAIFVQIVPGKKFQINFMTLRLGGIQRVFLATVRKQGVRSDQ